MTALPALISHAKNRVKSWKRSTLTRNNVARHIWNGSCRISSIRGCRKMDAIKSVRKIGYWMQIRQNVWRTSVSSCRKMYAKSEAAVTSTTHALIFAEIPIGTNSKLKLRNASSRKSTPGPPPNPSKYFQKTPPASSECPSTRKINVRLPSVFGMETGAFAFVRTGLTTALTGKSIVVSENLTKKVKRRK